MTRIGRIGAEALTAWRAFVRRRTALFFTFVFPVILIVIFGALVSTETGLFAESAVYYVPGYLAVVVLFTPLSRLSSTVARHRDGRRFEKLATTPLTATDWLIAQTLVTVVVVVVSAVLVLLLTLLLTDASVVLSPLLLPFVCLGAAVFSGGGAILGRLSDSRDGAVAASNAIGLPLLFLSETFVPPTLLPAWFRPLLSFSPLTYFARGCRALLLDTGGWETPLFVLGALGLVGVVAGVLALPWCD